MDSFFRDMYTGYRIKNHLSAYLTKSNNFVDSLGAWKQNNTLIFNITLPTKTLINIIAPDYGIANINNENFWIFNGGKVVYKNGENILFVSPKGQMYTTKSLIGEYKYNSGNQSISYIIKESSISSSTIEVQVQIEAFQ